MDIEFLNHGESIGGQHMKLMMESAIQAGIIINEGYGTAEGLETKSVGDVVTQVDNSADEAVKKVLSEGDPGTQIISEELSPDTTKYDEKYWIVDPLDGTNGFVFQAGRDIPSVMIARGEGRTIVAGLVYFPLTKEWYYGTIGRGSYRNGVRLSTVKSPSTLRNAWVDMNNYSDAQFETETFAKLRMRLRSKDGAGLVTTSPSHGGISVRIAGGGKKLSAVIIDQNLQKIKQRIWDIAAPQLIVEEAGGVFSDLKGKRFNPFGYGIAIAAASSELVKQIINLL